MTGKKITMTVSTMGRAKIEVEGYSGQECIAATKPLEALFSKEDTKREMTSGGGAPAHNEKVTR